VDGRHNDYPNFKTANFFRLAVATVFEEVDAGWSQEEIELTRCRMNGPR
jgi:hypothetical protein